MNVGVKSGRIIRKVMRRDIYDVRRSYKRVSLSIFVRRLFFEVFIQDYELEICMAESESVR